MNRSNKAISETVGTLILLGISVSLFSVLYISVIVINPTSASPSVNLICSLEGNNIIIEHRGGKALDFDTRFIVTIDETKYNERVYDHLNNSINNSFWNVGEKVIYTIPEDITNKKVLISLIDVNSNSVILMVNLQE